MWSMDTDGRAGPVAPDTRLLHKYIVSIHHDVSPCTAAFSIHTITSLQPAALMHTLSTHESPCPPTPPDAPHHPIVDINMRPRIGTLDSGPEVQHNKWAWCEISTMSASCFHMVTTPTWVAIEAPSHDHWQTLTRNKHLTHYHTQHSVPHSRASKE